MTPRKRDEKEAQEREAIRVLETEFFRRAKRGEVMTFQELKDFATSERLSPPSDAFLRRLRFKFEPTAVHSRFNKPKFFASPAFHHFGTVAIDYAEMPGLAGANFKRRGFVLGCETSTQKLGACFMTRKNLAGWEKAIDDLVTHAFPQARAILSDRERALTSRKFQDKMRERWGLAFFFLKGRHKAFHVERYIFEIKKRLSIAMKMNGTQRWSRFLQAAVDDHNSKRVPGTEFRRDEIDRSNFSSFLNQRYKTKDATSLFSVSTLDDDSLPPKARRVLWRYDVGDWVYLAIKSDYTFTSKEDLKMKNFLKPSRAGNYKRVYQIVDRKLKSAGKYRLTSCYVLRDPKTRRNLQGIFYQSELVPLLKPQTKNLA